MIYEIEVRRADSSATVLTIKNPSLFDTYYILGIGYTTPAALIGEISKGTMVPRHTDGGVRRFIGYGDFRIFVYTDK